MSEPEYIPDHPDRGVALITSDLQKPYLRALLRDVILAELQETEDFMFALIVDRWLPNDTGAQLDMWGKILNEPRGGLSDTLYRGFLEARIITNTSSGTIDAIVKVLRMITRSESVIYMPTYPAALILQYENPAIPIAQKQRVKNQIASMIPAGVGFEIVESNTNHFGFADDPDALGFSEGEWASII